MVMVFDERDGFYDACLELLACLPDILYLNCLNPLIYSNFLAP